MGAIVSLLYLVMIVAAIAGMWKVFEKAGQPGWAAIVPIYNLFILLQIVNKPVWWIVLLLIPLINIVILIMVSIALAEKFGKGGGFAVGMVFLPFVFYPMLGFGDERFQG
ncbi:hypothetical protein SAMN02745119_00170 [Trichlorobacter thiogenes]|uniref:Signal peptidase I n=1 Tax=Trichlorobacter thiogenes TaxID=115783 RepID=A0A1T4JXR9_9BACT|nr:DUF5684 domain-containing protein [Trichlorobacter thiogenes]SJZ35062.1 hypothetical protein SAMN02745119_00170 [Trichlorobacter thiogenes]